jgi:hypothetical protein
MVNESALAPTDPGRRGNFYILLYEERKEVV